MYDPINGTEMGSNLTYLLVYANDVTNDLFGLMLLIAFYLIVLISSLVMQMRYTARIRPEVSFLASSFAALGFAVILEMVSGILSPIYFFILVGLTILSFIWVAMSSG